MKRISRLIAAISGVILVSGASTAEIDWSKVDQAIGNPAPLTRAVHTSSDCRDRILTSRSMASR
jgi:hypothetical protein